MNSPGALYTEFDLQSTVADIILFFPLCFITGASLHNKAKSIQLAEGLDRVDCSCFRVPDSQRKVSNQIGLCESFALRSDRHFVRIKRRINRALALELASCA